MQLANTGAAAATDVFNDELNALLQKCKIPDEVKTFFKKYDCLEPQDIKFLGESEGEVVQAVKDNVDSAILNIGVIKNIRKL